MAAGRGDGMALVARPCHFAGLVGSTRRLCPATFAAKTAASRRSTRSPVTKRPSADDDQRNHQSKPANAARLARGMSERGQKAKYSVRAHVFRFGPESGLKLDIARGSKGATRRHRELLDHPVGTIHITLQALGILMSCDRVHPLLNAQ